MRWKRKSLRGIYRVFHVDGTWWIRAVQYLYGESDDVAFINLEKIRWAVRVGTNDGTEVKRVYVETHGGRK